MNVINWNYYSYYLQQNPSEEQQIEKAKKEAIEAAEKSKGAAGGYFEQSKQALSTNYDDLVKKAENVYNDVRSKAKSSEEQVSYIIICNTK